MNRPPPADVVRETAARAVTAVVNRLLDTDDRAGVHLARLEGRAIALSVVDRDWHFRLRVDECRLVFDAADADAAKPVDVAIRGRPADFVALAQASKRGESLAAGRLEITGDLAVAQEVQGLLRELDIDAEQWLSVYVGDVAAHRIGRAARAAGGAGQRGLDRLQKDLEAWLKHETRAVPQRHELEQFSRETLALSDDADRLAARVRRLREGRGR